MHNTLDEKIYSVLLESNLITKQSLVAARSESEEKNISLIKVLLQKDLISHSEIGKVVSDILKLPFIELSAVSIPDDVLSIIPLVVAKKQKIIAFKKDSRGLHVASSIPDNNQIVNFLHKKTGENILYYYTTEDEIQNSLQLYAKDIKKVFGEIIQENANLAIKNQESEMQIVKIVETIITYAYENKASDIHIEPLEDSVVIRFRIDGVLNDVLSIPASFELPIVMRIKVMAKLRTDEHQMAQDGKIQFKLDSENLDIRVSIAPTIKGEKVVLRLLSERSRQFSLSDLGFPDKDLDKIKRAYEKPYGMLLATGPTGCGKTTTMYAILKILNQRNVNIMTIEDPVEYDVEGVNQIQVNTKTGLTFASGLRSIVRQDPNIILVGEIRDDETAGIAINSAMTGHLVLSTMHTNDAATAVPRLFDMGVEPFLIASSVNVIVGQRLVRKICMQCRFSKEIDVESLSKYFPEEVIKNHFHGKNKIRVYEGKGCSVCHNTGYVDRIGIFEVMEVNEQVRSAITARLNSQELQNTAIKYGMRTMLDDGLEKIENGVTTIAEIVRTTKE